MEDKCKDCVLNTINGCSLDREPETCKNDIPLPLAMEVGLL